MTGLRDELRAYIAQQLPGVTELVVGEPERMPEGWSRECFTFSSSWRDAKGAVVDKHFILRRDPAGSLVYTDRTLEYTVLQRLAERGFPVPKLFSLSTGHDELGAPFMIMERLAGTSSPEVLYAADRVEQREQIGHDFLRLLAELHTLHWQDLDIPFDVVPTEDTAADAALDHWERTMQEQQLEPQPLMVQLMKWFRANKPKAQRVCLLHGDYRTGNFLFQDDHITGVVDWELASLGDPVQDLGWAFMKIWRLDGKICGFFDADETIRLYEKYSGLTVDRDALRYWEAFNYFRHAVMALTGTRTRCDKLTDEVNFAISHLYQPVLLDNAAQIIGI